MNNLIKKTIALVFCLLCFVISSGPACATRLPKGLLDVFKSQIKPVSKRLDGVLKTKSGELYVPVISQTQDSKDKKDIRILFKYPEADPQLVVFNNGWAFIKLVDKEEKKILELPAECPDNLKQQLKSGKLPSDLIVPQNMAVTGDFQETIGELDVEVLASSQQTSATGTAPQVEQKDYKVFVSSPQTGKIIILDKDFEKVSELQMDGTPGGMAFTNDSLYICDQTKDRILAVNPGEDKFAGQINLKSGSRPNGIVSRDDGKFLYICETGTSFVSVVELATKKLLIKTRVSPGPTKIAITPNGYMLLVVSGQTGELTFVSTLNQKAVGRAKVGELPSDIIISKNSKAAFVTNRVSNTVSIIDITHRKVARTIKVGEGPTGLALSPDESLLFVANAKENTIVAYKVGDYSRVKDAQLPLDVEFPGKILFLPGTNKLLVTSAATDTIGVLDTDSMEFVKQARINCTSNNAIWVPK